jgi:DNA polymerase-3 subunit delta
VLHLFYGPDTFSRNEALAVLRDRLDGDGMLSTNTVIFDGRSVKPDELVAACDTVPFLAPARLVMVEGLLAAVGGREGRRPTGARGRARAGGGAASGASDSPWVVLPEYVGRLPDSTELVLVDGAVGDNNWLLAALRPLGEDRSFAPPAREALQDWIVQRARARNAAINPRAVAALADTVGADLWRLDAELEKLSLYAYGRAIEAADVRAMVSAAQTGNIFQLVDAVMDRRGDEALRLVRLLMDGGAAGPYLLTMIARQYRQLLLVQDMKERGVPRPEMMRRLEVRSDFVFGKLLNQAGRIAAARLEADFRRLLEADLSIKRGIHDEETALELLVAEQVG